MLATPLVAAVLALFALAAGNDLSDLRVDAGGAGSGSGSPATATTATIAPDDAEAGGSPPGTGTGAGSTPVGTGSGGAGVPGAGDPEPGQPGVGGLAPGGGIVTASTEAGSGAGVLGSTTTASGGLSGIPVDTGLDATGTTLDAATDASAAADGQPDATLGQDGSDGSTAPAVSTTSAASARPAEAGESTNSTTAATRRGGGGSGSGLAATLRLVALIVAFGASAAGVAWLTASLVRAVLTGRRQRRPDDEDDDDSDLAALVVIDHASAGWTLEQLRRRLEAEPDPRLAIREAYSVVESGFGIGGGLARRRTETALQYLERTLGMIEGGTKPLRVLTGLFLLARFSNRPMNEPMRRAAIDAVVELQARFRAAEEMAA